MAANIAGGLRAAIITNSAITSQLPAYAGSFPVFRTRPAPANAPYPMILISPTVSAVDTFGRLAEEMPDILHDVSVYSDQESDAEYARVEAIARAIYDQFHRTRRSVTVPGYNVISVTATGPIPAPVDDDAKIGRVVTLRFRLEPQ